MSIRAMEESLGARVSAAAITQVDSAADEHVENSLVSCCGHGVCGRALVTVSRLFTSSIHPRAWPATGLGRIVAKVAPDKGTITPGAVQRARNGVSRLPVPSTGPRLIRLGQGPSPQTRGAADFPMPARTPHILASARAGKRRYVFAWAGFDRPRRPAHGGRVSSPHHGNR